MPTSYYLPNALTMYLFPTIGLELGHVSVVVLAVTVVVVATIAFIFYRYALVNMCL